MPPVTNLLTPHVVAGKMIRRIIFPSGPGAWLFPEKYVDQAATGEIYYGFQWSVLLLSGSTYTCAQSLAYVPE